jgi:hypothetical protein
MRTFHMRYRFKHPVTEDFIAVVNGVSGKDLKWFFDELFFNTLNFDYGVASLRSSEKPVQSLGVFDVNGKREEMTVRKIAELKKKEKPARNDKIYVTTVTLRRFGEVRVGIGVPLKVRVVFADGSEEVREWDGQGRWAKLKFEKPVKAKLAQIDPDMIWLIDSNQANNGFRIETKREGVFRVAAKFLFLIQNLLLAAGSVS